MKIKFLGVAFIATMILTNINMNTKYTNNISLDGVSALACEDMINESGDVIEDMENCTLSRQDDTIPWISYVGYGCESAYSICYGYQC